MTGKISMEGLELTLSGFAPPDGPRLDQVELHGRKAEVNLEERSGTSEEGTVKVTLGEGSLEEFLRKKLPEMVSQPKVKLDGNEIQIMVQVNLLIKLQVTCVCKLRIENEQQVFVDLVSVDKPGPVFGMVENQLASVNPVFNAASLPLPLRLVSQEIQEGNIFVFGRWKVPSTF